MADLEETALSGPTRWARIILVIGLVYWTWRFAFTPLGEDAMDAFIHLPDLVFHEAGHMIFSPLGQFMTVLGGSLMQVLVPVVAAVAFVRQEQPFGAAICVWWAGQNLVDLAPYIADARALQLVLLGGRNGGAQVGVGWPIMIIPSPADLAGRYRVSNGSRFRLKDIDPADPWGKRLRPIADEVLKQGCKRLGELQERLYAQDRWSVLLIFQ